MFVGKKSTVPYLEIWKHLATPQKKKTIQDVCHLNEQPSDRFVDIFQDELFKYFKKKYTVTPYALYFPTFQDFLRAVSNCKNTTTFMGDDIDELDPRYIYVTKNGYCHDIHDLITYLIRSQDTDIDPHDETKTIPLWTDAHEKKLFFQHPFLHPLKKKQYEKMKQKLKPIYPSLLSPSTAHRVFDSLSDVIYISMSTDMVKCTYAITARWSETLSLCSPQEKKNILNWKNNTGSTLSARLRTKNICNNQYAQKLLLIYLYQYHIHYNSVIDLPWFIQRRDSTEYHVMTRGGPFFSTWSRLKKNGVLFYNPLHFSGVEDSV